MNTTKNEFSISARVVHINIPEVITEKITKRIIVIETYSDNYRKETPIEFINDNIKCLKDIKEKDWVNVDFRIGGWKIKEEYIPPERRNWTSNDDKYNYAV